jgi:hypothetical protein
MGDRRAWHEEGRKAYRAGLAFADNPYTLGSHKLEGPTHLYANYDNTAYFAWCDGFDAEVMKQLPEIMARAEVDLDDLAIIGAATQLPDKQLLLFDPEGNEE